MSFNNPFSFRSPFASSTRVSAHGYSSTLRQTMHLSPDAPRRTQQPLPPVDLNLMCQSQEDDSVPEAYSTFVQSHNAAQRFTQTSTSPTSVHKILGTNGYVLPASEGYCSPNLIGWPNSFSSKAIDNEPSQIGAQVHIMETESPNEECVPSTQIPEDEPTLTNNEDVQPTKSTSRKGRKGGRNHPASKPKKPSMGRFFWDLRAQVILMECKKHYDEKRSTSDLYQKIKTNEEQWIDIVALCATQGLAIDWQQAYEKHKRLSINFREINDWERNTPSGKDSYWCMTPAQRLAEGKFTHCNFSVELYELMDRLFGLDKAVNPTATVMDTSNGIPCRGSSRSPVGAQSTSEASAFESTPTNGGVERKSRKRTHTFDVGLLAEATKDLMRGWELAEEGKKQRHEKAMEENHTQHEEIVSLERQKLEISLLFANGVQGIAAAMSKMADKL